MGLFHNSNHQLYQATIVFLFANLTAGKHISCT